MIAIMPAARNPARSTESVARRRIAEGLGGDSEAVVEHDAAPVLALVDQHAADLRAVELQPELELGIEPGHIGSDRVLLEGR